MNGDNRQRPTDRQTNGRTDGRTRTEGQTGGRMHGRADSRTDGRTDGQLNKKTRRRMGDTFVGVVDGQLEHGIQAVGRHALDVRDDDGSGSGILDVLQRVRYGQRRPAHHPGQRHELMSCTGNQLCETAQRRPTHYPGQRHELPNSIPKRQPALRNSQARTLRPCYPCKLFFVQPRQEHCVLADPATCFLSSPGKNTAPRLNLQLVFVQPRQRARSRASLPFEVDPLSK